MTRIVDPNVDRLFGGKPPEQPVQVIQGPLNDVQIVALLAAHVSSWKPHPHQAVNHAMDLLAEAIVQMGQGHMGLKERVDAILQRGRPPVTVLPTQ